jgi:hypothetical protein
MKRNLCIVLTASLLLLVSQQGCKQVQHITISGTVYIATQQGGSVTAANGAKITVSTDVNGNGRIGLREQATATADSNGHYTIHAPVSVGMQSVVRFSLDGHAPLLKTVQINTLLAITGFDGTLVEMDSLSDAKNGKWRNQAGSVEINWSKIAGGSVRNFNPATEADKFPGSFSDNKGSMLISGVFTAFDLQDADGKPLTTTASGSPARIRMRVPRDTWGAVVDTAPGTGRIDVPMYYFNEETGQWVRGTTEQGDDLSGWLEQENGDIIAESQLTAVQSGTFAGQIFAASDVTHFSYWNVDWPISSHACISGTLLDSDGNPLAGATINVAGVTYTGNSSPQTTDENGKFCVDVMRSEAPGEDINNNGVTGETQKVLITCSNGGKLYNFGEFEMPVQSGTCPTDCLTVELKATADKEVQVSLCSLSGAASVEGAPKAGIFVYAYDDLIDPQVWEDTCGTCTPYAYTDAAGAFSMSSPVALKPVLMGMYTEETSDPLVGTFIYMSQKTLMGCPTQPVNLNLELLFCIVSSPTIDLTGDTISLSPDIPLTVLIVTGTTGLKWLIYATDESGFSGPVTYGTVPSGATQSQPLSNGTPMALATGDIIMVVPLGGYIPYQGRQCYSNSMYTVP